MLLIFIVHIVSHVFQDGYLQCSCKQYERFGYPCHHLLHVLNCFSTNQIQREWIHIRWSKEYLLNYLHPSTDPKFNEVYEKLYDFHPNGIKYQSLLGQTYPIYKGFENESIDSSQFEVPDSQFMCQKTLTLWVESNKTNDPHLNRLLAQNSSDMIEQTVVLSQQQQLHISLSQDDNAMILADDSASESDGSQSHFNPPDEEVMNWNDNVGLLKRGFQLAAGNVDKHRQLYTLLCNFVTENEINHNDNEIVFANRNKDDVITISSNKIVNTKHKSMKRKKARHELYK